MKAKNISLIQSTQKQSAFCQAWPMAKQGLQLLAEIVKNPFLKSSIKLIISAGDTISSSICGNQPS